MLAVYSGEPVVAIPVRTNIGRHDVSQRVETISDKVPIASVRLNKILQELVILRSPKLIGDAWLLHTLRIGGRGSNDETVVGVPIK